MWEVSHYEHIIRHREWEQELVEIAKEIVAETDDYVHLPTKFDIHEYSIMEDFCLSLDDPELRESFCDRIRGSGAFRRFKDAIQSTTNRLPSS